MRLSVSRRTLSLAGASALVLLGLTALPGCKGDSQLSQKELQQIKDGPPKEMPAEARAMMQRGAQGRQGPPPGAGGPPPGAAGK